MCGAYYLDFCDMVSVSINNEKYCFCVDCISSYFETIETMKPFYYCVICGNLTTCGDYIHSWTGCNICENCIDRFQKCEHCGRYDEDIRNGICGLCGGW